VVIVSRADGKVVLKGAVDLPQELFATDLARRLGLLVPCLRLIISTDPEWEECKCNVKQALKAQPGAHSRVCSRNLNRAHFAVMEYVNGFNLHHVRAPTLQQIFHEEAPFGEAILTEFGQVIAFDVLCHNSDRLPCFWENEGNLRNLILYWPDHSLPPRLVLIDNTLSCIRADGPPSERFLSQVASFVVRLQATPPQLLVETQRFKERMSTSLGIKLTDGQLLTVQDGILRMFKKIATLPPMLFDQLRTQVANSIVRDYRDVWKLGVEAISVPFLQHVRIRICESLAGSLSL